MVEKQSTNWERLYDEKNAYLRQYFEEVTPFEFYRSIFPEGTFERKGIQTDRKPNGIALIIKGGRNAYHRILTDELDGLQELFNEDFVITSPVSYFGERRTGQNARYLHALAFDLDGVEMQQLYDLLHQMKNEVIPKATFIVNSGHGLHLYFQLTEPLPMYPKNQNFLRILKAALTPVVWNQFTSNRDDPETQSVLQGFRMPGTPSKMGRAYPVRAFRIYDPVSIDYLLDFVPAHTGELQRAKEALAGVSRLTLEQAKKKYPEWYDKRIVQQKPRGQWHLSANVYRHYLERLKKEIRVGHRYNGVLSLAVYAMKCPDVTPEQLREDAYSLIAALDAMTTDPANHFTVDDVEAALEAYNEVHNEVYVRWTREHIERLTGLQIPPNKRNGRKQAAHLARARAVQAIDYPDGEWRGNPSQEKRVWAYLDEHPDASKKEVMEALGLSKPTVIKHWKSWVKERM